MAKQKDFDRFLSNIEPSASTVSYISSVQNNLRDYLKKHSMYESILIDTFLSGSYAKHTSIRPSVNDKKRDVDIIVVTNHTKDDDPSEVLQELRNVLAEKELYKSAFVQTHSVSLVLSQISVDVVPVIGDDSADDLYCVASSKDNTWDKTDPKGHKRWATEVNHNNNNEYKPLVKIFKWWRKKNCPSDVKYPKGITLEKIIADNLGDSSLSTEDFLIGTMQSIVDAYKTDYVQKGLMPVISDPSSQIVGNDLLSGYKFDDFKLFINQLEEHLNKLNEEGTTNVVWRTILGNEFPSDSTQASASYSLSRTQQCLNVSHRMRAPWPMRRSGFVFISAQIIDENSNTFIYENDSFSIKKHCTIIYTAHYSSCRPYYIKWQIVNTGAEAARSNGLRGGFENSNIGIKQRKESTLYTGKHYVQCFVIDREGNCIAKSKEFFINVE